MAEVKRILLLVLVLALCPGALAAQDPTGRDIPVKKSEKKPSSRPSSTPKRNNTRPAAPRPAPAPAAPVSETPPKVATSARLIISAPPGAQVELDGRRSYTVDQAGHLVLDGISTGPHRLLVTASGHDSWRGVVTVTAPATGFTVPMRGNESTGRMTIFISEPGTEIFVDDRPQGIKSVSGQPITVSGLRPGTHEVRAVRPGFEPWRERVQIQAGLSRTLTVNLKPKLEPEALLIAAGEFTMGSDRGPKDARPAHLVKLDRFAIARSEVTNRLYKYFIDAAGHPPPLTWIGRNYPEGKDDEPVVGVTWSDAEAFTRWLSQQSGKRYRLPTEAEWEKAVRTKGSEFTSIGRVWEWCADWYDQNYYKRSETINPQGPPRGKNVKVKGFRGEARVIRGGVFEPGEMESRAAVREYFVAARGRDDIGFRVVLDLGAK